MKPVTAPTVLFRGLRVNTCARSKVAAAKARNEEPYKKTDSLAKG